MKTRTDGDSFTMADARYIQECDVAAWATVLSQSAYNKLKAEVDRRNAEGYRSPYRVFRGQDISSFVSNLARQSGEGVQP